MLALILAACVGPTRDRFVCAEDVPYLYVRAYEDLSVSPDAEVSCARTERRPEAYAGFDRIPLDLATTLGTLRTSDDVESTVAGLLDGFTTVTYDPDGLTRAVFEFGTRHGDVQPPEDGEARAPVDPSEGLASSVTTPRGVEVVGLGPGLVAEDRDTLVVRCTDCDVFVPATPARLHLELTRANLHLCLGERTFVDGFLDDTALQVQVGAAEQRWLLRTGTQVDLGEDTTLTGVLQQGTRIEGGGLCR